MRSIKDIREVYSFMLPILIYTYTYNLTLIIFVEFLTYKSLLLVLPIAGL